MAAGQAGRAHPAYPGLARRVPGGYAFSWAYLGCFVVIQVVYAQLSAHGQSELTAWASTSVVNLEHDPVGSLVVSAFITGGDPVVWRALIALAVFGANRALGNRAVVLVCLAGQVVGSLVSEGIVAYRQPRRRGRRSRDRRGHRGRVHRGDHGPPWPTRPPCASSMSSMNPCPNRR